ncbi:MAG: Cell division protein ftsA [Microgenomates group bacterium GW2011_GWB1_44_8]|uniref:Cell division protein FtsA n=1 Tax=Candidatus Woesebacteria bacterium GW2011_GWA1_43_12 TaxID=1618557 RepID=A0A0G1CYG2_9BACT|nr:MAG: Cell division protein ftsA [Candidatus Woesebacteria bacterium GW2011_GWA1_43_12]KKT78519.1 MAG: Cell division protein ftsA [Microgenomates group bacterium GW2011_GWB1_44_8]
MPKSRQVSAIDIGSTKITTLVAQSSEDDERIHVIGVSSIPSRGVRKGQIVNIEEASASILECLEIAERMAGYSIGRVFVSVGGPQVQSQNSTGVVAVSQSNGEIGAEDVHRVMEAARAISLPTAQEILHVLPRSFTVDGQEGVRDPVGMTGVRLEVDTHIVTGSSTALKNLTKCIGEVGSDIAGLVYSGLASSLASLSETEKELGVVLIDIGGGTTSLAVYTEGALCVSSVLPIGARHVTNDLAIGLRISLESAEKIKTFVSEEPKDHGSATGEKGGKEKEDELDLASLSLTEGVKTISKKTVVEGIIRPRLNEIANIVGAELKKAGVIGLTPAGVVITGGGSLTTGAQDSFKRSLALPVRIGIPIGVTGLVDDISSPAYSTAVGLLIYGSKFSDALENKSPFAKRMQRSFDVLPIKGLATRVVDLIKSLLP